MDQAGVVGGGEGFQQLAEDVADGLGIAD